MNYVAPVYHTYKDRVFRLLFKDRKRLLELYNALNDTHYTNEEDLTINTLENAIYMKMKNDISFIIDCNMCLYEHQSSYTPNMPLRGFLYFADLYKKLLKDTDLSVRRLIKIPTPNYIVFYNGLERKEEEFIQKLSDAFEDDKDGCMELTVRVININLGHSKELLDKCSALYGYAYFVSAVRKYLETMELTDAVSLAVEECLREDILTDFLLEHKAEVVAMSIYEYNEEYVKRVQYEDGMEEGYSKGYESGYGEGVNSGIELGEARKLVQNVDAVMSKLGIELIKACEILNATLEEYERCRQTLMNEKSFNG